MKDKKFLTTGDVARHCGVHFRTVTRWIQKGHLKAFHLPGRGDSRVLLDDFILFLNANKIEVPLDLLSGSKKNLRALVIEDDVSMARTIKRSLEAMGFECELATDGFKAGVLLGTFQPSLATLDLNMPGLGGQGVLDGFKQQKTTIGTKVLVISGMEEAQLKKAVQNGADSYLKKPFNKKQFEASVRSIMGL